MQRLLWRGAYATDLHPVGQWKNGAKYIRLTPDDFAIDLLGLIEIMFDVEGHFSITVPPEPPDARTPINTLNDLIRYLDRLVSEQHGATKADEAMP